MSIDRQFGWMWAQACELLDRADRMQRGFVRYVGPSADAAVRADAAVWEPPVDIQETPGGLQFVFALPGVNAEHIEVSLEPNALTVSAIRPARLGSSDSVIRRMEIPHGRFLRRIALAGARLRLGDTRYVNGCLEVRLVRVGPGTGDNRGQE
ncbi:MAG: hypothetical protein QOI59_2161 [Gammaproteobacteria bacterium]|jgi:HSP20 family molecular chaperone IbpA|nr:hypothetical protein [Gammaproteobacteria bacterium]